MSEDTSKLSCEEFQSQIPVLLASDADIENHAHVKTCAICHQLLREIENIAENARHFRFGGNESHPDDWSATTYIMTPEGYLELQFKKSIHHGHIHNAELNPTPSELLMAKLEGKESCLVLVRTKRQQCLWFTDRRLLRQDASDVIELFPYRAVKAVHWMSREHPFFVSKSEYFDRLEIDLDEGGVEIDGLDQAYLLVFQFLGFVASKRTAGE